MSYTTIDCCRCARLFDVEEELGGYDTLPITDASHPWWSAEDRRVRGETYRAAYCRWCKEEEEHDFYCEDEPQTLGDA